MPPKQKIDIQLIWRSIHDQLNPEEQRLLQEWLNADESNRRYFLQAKRYYSKGSSFQNTGDELKKAWNAFERRERFSRKRVFFRKMLAAASILVLVVATSSVLLWQFNAQKDLIKPEQVQLIRPGSGKATLFFDNGQTYELTNSGKLDLLVDGVNIVNSDNGLAYTSQQQASTEARFNILRVPRGGEYVVTLPDGTHVWLNAASSLRYPTRFDGDERIVELMGQAYFEVSHNPEKPFLVLSGNQQIEVLGTQFDLNAYPTDETIVTTLVKGSIQVSLKNRPEVQEILNPAEQSTFDKATNSISIKQVDTAVAVSWRNGKYVFQDEELDHLMKTLERWYDCEVVFASEKAKHVRFTGTFMRYSSMDKVLNQIAKTNEIKIEIQGNRIRIE